MTESEIVVPVVHMNGTAKSDLIEQQSEVYLQLSNVLDAMRAAAPNGRDYYPVPGLMEKAIAQHMRRMGVITGLMDEIQQQVEMINLQ